MATKIVPFSPFNSPVKEELKPLKPIELVKFISDTVSLDAEDDKYIYDAHCTLGIHWGNVSLISKGVKFDVIAVWSNDARSNEDVAVYLGHWNDGVVE